MAIAALWEESTEKPTWAERFVEGFECEAIGTAADEQGRAWLAHRGPHATRFVHDGIAVVSEGAGGTDATGIALGYRRHGIRCAAELSGSFTFLLFDERERLLVAASDAACRAPLVHWSDAEGLALSSSALHLLAHPRLRGAVDDAQLAHLLTGFSAAAPGTTPLLGVRRLLPGVALVARRRVLELVAVDRLVARGQRTRDRTAWIEAFWSELEAAVDRAVGSTPSACLALSGGLDSAAVASAIARRSPGFGLLASFSIVAPKRAADESDAIARLEAAYDGSIHNHRVDCSDATELSDLDPFGLSDDPHMTPLALLPSRLRLWRAAEQAGVRTVLDGEGGDELFGTLFGPREAVLRGRWRAAWHHLRSRRGARRTMLARAFVLPLLSRGAQRAWAARKTHDRRGLPSYLAFGSVSQRAIEQATQEFYEAQIELDFEGELQRWLSNPAVAGAFATHERMASTFGIGLVSPLLDRSVVELVLGIPAEWMLSVEGKAFLPHACVGRVPNATRLQPKDTRLPSDFLRTLVSGRAARRALRDPRVRDRLAGWVRFERVEGLLEAIAKGYDPEDDLFWAQITGLVSFAYWYARASREYGVR